MFHAENLAAYLAGRERGVTQARWRELVPDYQRVAQTTINFRGRARGELGLKPRRSRCASTARAVPGLSRQRSRPSLSQTGLDRPRGTGRLMHQIAPEMVSDLLRAGWIEPSGEGNIRR
jgi:hypothetical protein